MKLRLAAAKGTEPTTRQVLGPRAEATTIILLKGHSIKLTPDDLPLWP